MKRISIVAVPLLVTVIVWAVSVPSMALQSGDGLMQLFGSLALVGFATVMLLSTRWRVLDRWFGGLDKMLVVHKWLGVASVGFVVVHLATRLILFGRSHSGMGQGGDMMGQPVHLPFSEAAAMLFVILLIFALWVKRMKYETWQLVHKAMALAYVCALTHYYIASMLAPFGASPFSLWIDITAITGVASAVYSVFLYNRLSFRHTYVVTAVRGLARDVAEISGRATSAPLELAPGQFVFAKFPESKFPAHPLTVSGTPAADEITITVKDLGDNTRHLVETVKPDDTFALSGPYGQFDYTRGGVNQVWVAGGIGITPFHAFLGAPVPPRFSIDLFYGHHGPDQAIYATELAAALPGNVRLHLMDDAADGLMTSGMIIAQCQTKPDDIYFCGPTEMRRALQPGFKAAGIKFHYEEFQFR